MILFLRWFLLLLLVAPGKLELMSWSSITQCLLYYSRRLSFVTTTKNFRSFGYVECCLDKHSELFIDSRPKFIDCSPNSFFSKTLSPNALLLDIYWIQFRHPYQKNSPKIDNFSFKFFKKILSQKKSSDRSRRLIKCMFDIATLPKITSQTCKHYCSNPEVSFKKSFFDWKNLWIFLWTVIV